MKEKSKAGYIIAICLLGAVSAFFMVLYVISSSASLSYSKNLEYIYEKNFYDLADNINNTENKLAKTLTATSNSMQEKYLKEVSNNTRLAVANLNNLPYNLENLSESVAFVNQVSGYTETLAKSLENGKSLSNKETKTLEQIYDSILYMKDSIGRINQKVWEGYNIVNAAKLNGDKENNFTSELAKIKQVDVDYPTMIYDGPFSNSVVNKKIKGLNAREVSKETALSNLLNIFVNVSEGNVEFTGESRGKFETYNFSVKRDNGQEYLYIQMTKKGGNLLTASSFTDNTGENITTANAKEIALNFAKRCGLKNMDVVWVDSTTGNAYINLAPVQDGIILYPDLVKVKIDLGNGDVLGFEATNYYTNHTERNLLDAKVSKVAAKQNIPSKFTIVSVRESLIPLDYNEEVLAWEVCAKLGTDEYYFYYNTQNGAEENILKVIRTSIGTLLM